MFWHANSFLGDDSPICCVPAGLGTGDSQATSAQGPAPCPSGMVRESKRVSEDPELWHWVTVIFETSSIALTCGWEECQGSLQGRRGNEGYRLGDDRDTNSECWKARRASMPIFEFLCEKCGQFELMLTLDEVQGAVACPNCSAIVKRIYSPPSFFRVFSGIRHQLSRRNEKGCEPRVVRGGEDDTLEKRALPKACEHDHPHGHTHGHADPNYPPWMIKH